MIKPLAVVTAFVLAGIVAVPACAQTPLPPAGSPAYATAGMVSSAHPLATDAGAAVLNAGGNAFDAAVAVAAALGVVEPAMSGIGGYGTILIHDARTGRTRFLNASGRIPRAVDSDVFRAPTPGWEENRRGAMAVSTPGNVNAWEALWREHGTRQWADLLAPAIRLAENGFTLGERGAAQIAAAYAAFPESARAIYGRAGQPLGTGDTLVQRDLGRTLRAIAADGATAVHGGAIGERIAATVHAAGGFLSLDDLRDNEAEWWEPIAIEYRDVRVFTAAPPANAFDALVRLGIMSWHDPRTLGHNSGAYLHVFAEATKHGFWTRLAFAGDPDHAPPPLARLLSASYWTQQALRIDPNRASVFTPPVPADSAAGPRPDGHTTHFVVADRWGNVVSATQTLGNAFGARILPEGTGVWLNNSLAYSTFEPKGNPMDAHAGRRKLSGDVPLILFRDGRPWAALGTPGGHTIGQTIVQVVMNMVDFGLDVHDAIALPRVSFVEPNTLAVEDGISGTARAALAARGHELRVVPALGNVHGLTIEYGPDGTPGRFTGAADSRGEGSARGVNR
jgi:gamma-glutamyltranspeptidase / glutathione hydrolase